jgi:hypothetical protein
MSKPKTKTVLLQIELSPRDLHALVRIAEEMGEAKDKFADQDTLEFLEKLASAFDKAATKLKDT